MTSDPRTKPAYLLQEDVIRDYIPSVGTKQWQVVYTSTDRNPDSFTVFSGLVPSAKVAAALGHESWDLSIGDGLPSFSQSSKGKKRITTYHRFGGFDEVRPLVIFRQFHGAWPSYVEICEEFRHFHDLAEDHERGTLLAFDGSGYPIEAARVQSQRVEIRLSYLLQFLAATQLHLALFFDIRRFSLVPLEDIPDSDRDVEHTDERSRFFRHVRKCDFNPDFQTFSRLLGKVLIAPSPIQQCGKWPFPEKAEADPEVTFIISVDQDDTRASLRPIQTSSRTTSGPTAVRLTI